MKKNIIIVKFGRINEYPHEKEPQVHVLCSPCQANGAEVWWSTGIKSLDNKNEIKKFIKKNENEIFIFHPNSVFLESYKEHPNLKHFLTEKEESKDFRNGWVSKIIYERLPDKKWAVSKNKP